MDLGMTPIRDTNGTLISIVFDVDKYKVANYNINLFSKEAKDYIFLNFLGLYRDWETWSGIVTGKQEALS